MKKYLITAGVSLLVGVAAGGAAVYFFMLPEPLPPGSVTVKPLTGEPVTVQATTQTPSQITTTVQSTGAGTSQIIIDKLAINEVRAWMKKNNLILFRAGIGLHDMREMELAFGIEYLRRWRQVLFGGGPEITLGIPGWTLNDVRLNIGVGYMF